MTRPLLTLVFLLASVHAVSAQAPASAIPKPTPTPDVDKALETFKSGKFDEALEQLKKAHAADPQMQPPRVILAGWFLLAEKGKEARLTLERFAADDPKHPDGYLLNANFAFHEGRVTDAILSCQAALQFAADARWDAGLRSRFVRDARLGLAAGYERRGDWVSAKEPLNGLLNDDPKNGSHRARLAAATFHCGKPEEAFADFRKAAQDDPAADPAELSVARLWLAKGDRDKAEEWLKKAVSAHAANPKAHRAYAGSLLDDGKWEAAQLYLEAAIKLEPKARETAALLALSLRHKRDYAEAEAAFEQLHKDAPGDPFALGNLAIVLAESTGDPKRKRAVELAETFVKQHARAADAHAVLGFCYFKAGRLDDADRALGTAASGGQIGLDTAYYLALVLDGNKKYAEAHKILTEAVATRGPFVYRPQARALLADVTKLLPEKKDEPKK